MPPLLTSGAHALCSLVLASGLLMPAARAQQQPSPPTPAQDEEIIRVSTELVQTDVTVLDKQGRFVDNLRREQFELLVDGQPRPIAFFERLTAGSSREAALVSARDGARASAAEERGSATTPTAAERGRTVFFFVDDQHLAPGSLSRVRDTLRRFVDNAAGPKDQVAITTASGQLGFLQQLTASKEVLRTAIERLRYRPYDVTDTVKPPMTEYQALAIERNDRDTLQLFVDMQVAEMCRMMGARSDNCDPERAPLGNNAVLDEVPGRNPNSRGGSSSSGGTGGSTSTGGRLGTTSRGGGPPVRQMATGVVKARAHTIIQLAANATRNTLASLESLIRTAGTLPERKLVVFISDGFFIQHLTSTNTYDMRRITDAALRTGTIIYTIDARGLVTGQTDASTSGVMDVTGRVMRSKLGEIPASQEAFHTLAEETGGRAYINANDLAPGLSRALQETAAYYLLAWRPEPPGQGQDRFRRIQVRVKDQPDLTVRVRRGFFEDAGGTAQTSAAAAANRPRTVEAELLAAVRAAYPRRGVPVTLSAGHMYVPGSGMSVAASALVKAESAEADLMAVIVNDKGDVVSSLQQHLTGPPAPAAAQGGRMSYTMQFPNLAPGLYQVRVAARDSKSARTGSAVHWVEIPDTAAGAFALSSIFLSEVPAGAGQAQKAFLSPDRRFARTSRMRFQAQIYNAAQSPAPPNLTLELQLTSGGQTLVATPPTPVAVQGVTDLARIPLTGEFPLDGFAPGAYTMAFTITDRGAKKSLKQQIDFVVE